MNLSEYEQWENEAYCLAAVRQDGHALVYVKVQTPKICEEAVKQDGDALQYVKEQTPKICEEAVKQNGDALRYVCIKDVFKKLMPKEPPAKPKCGREL